MFNLQSLPILLRQALIISDFNNDRCNVASERLLQFLDCGIGVLDGVVQQRRSKGGCIGYARFIGQDIRHGDRVIDVWTGVRALAALVAVLVGGEGASGEDD